ncbi:PAS domain S-box protein [Leptospira inadai serovar Lyme str. 10]|uniref:histidine kinase n=2 Tax=Leptospira inadai serovar Lyme TaxID=293084 RepID=V6HMT8_9LEPT|nr:PAS domain S-box protein [Leptospira inadai]EQA38210.1 PAS domain S-box protein [Leptospira inadai serovar Lyme str. 10]PNV74026.1 PAS domain-containing sensor histidine kinase [Leptospira inadai serovar Lyme]
MTLFGGASSSEDSSGIGNSTPTESFYYRTLNLLQEAIFLLDGKGRITFANARALQWLGGSSKDLLGRHFYECPWTIVRTIGMPFQEDTFLEKITGEEGGSFPDLEIVTASGVSFSASLKFDHIKTEDGQTSHILLSFFDETNRKKVQSYNLQLAAAINDTADAVFITSLDGNIEFVNPAFEKLTGYSLGEIRGSSPNQLKSGLQDQSFYKRLWETILKGETFRATVINKKKNGDLFHCDQTISSTKDSTGKIISFVSILKDVTEEMEMQRTLRVTSERLRSLLDNALEGIFAVYNRQVIYGNPAFFKMLGYDPDSSSSLIRVADILADRDQRNALNGILSETGKIQGEEVRLLKKDGSPFYGTLRVFAHSQNPDYLEGFLLDQTERKMIETEKDSYESILRRSQKLESIGLIAAAMIHEINNPLTIVLGYSNLLAKSLVDLKLLKYVDIISSEADRLSRLVKDLLLYAKGDGTSFERVDPYRLRDEALTLAFPLLQIEKIKVEEGQERESLPLILCQSQKIKQVLLNLLLNAKDALCTEATENKFLGIDVVGIKGESGIVEKIRFEVWDSGPGVPQFIRNTIFDAFFTAKESRGTGLGLAISKKIVESHHGSIGLAEKSGKFSRFYFELPIDCKTPI